jgi:hypothetical protein
MLLPYNKLHEFLYVLLAAISLNIFSSVMAFDLSQTAMLAFSSTLSIASFLVWIDMYANSKKIAGVSIPLVSLTIISALILSSYLIRNVPSFDIPSEKILYLALFLLSAAITCLWKIAFMYFAINEYAAATQSLSWRGNGDASLGALSERDNGFDLNKKAKNIYHSYMELCSIVFSCFSKQKNLSRQIFKSSHQTYALLPLMLLMVLLIVKSELGMIVSALTPLILLMPIYIGRDFADKKRLMAYSWLLARGVSREQYNMQLVWMLISHYIFVYIFSVSFIALCGAASPDTLYLGLSSIELAIAISAAGVFQICLTLEASMRAKPESDSRLTFLIYYFIFVVVLGLNMFLISMSAFWLPFLIILGGGSVFYSLNRWQAYDLQME